MACLISCSQSRHHVVDVLVVSSDHHHQRPWPKLRQCLRQFRVERRRRADDEAGGRDAAEAARLSDGRCGAGVTARSGDQHDEIRGADLVGDRRRPAVEAGERIVGGDEERRVIPAGSGETPPKSSMRLYAREATRSPFVATFLLKRT